MPAGPRKRSRRPTAPRRPARPALAQPAIGARAAAAGRGRPGRPRGTISRRSSATASRLGILNTAAFGFAYLARAEWVAGGLGRARWCTPSGRSRSTWSPTSGSCSPPWSASPSWCRPPAGSGRRPRQYLRTDGGQRHRLRAIQDRPRRCRAPGSARRAAMPGAVLAALDPVRRFAYRDAADEPGFWTWQDLYADALVATGRAEEADAFLRPARGTGRGPRAASARRPAGPLAGPGRGRARQAGPGGGGVRARAGRAPRAARPVRAGAASSSPPGRFLRRAGQRRRAADLLGAAEERFAALGARPVRGALREGAGRVRAAPDQPAVGRDRAELTAQELVVARLAAGGPQQPGARRRAGGEHQDHRVPPAQRVPEARRDLPQAAGRPAGRARRRPDPASGRSHCMEAAAGTVARPSPGR